MIAIAVLALAASHPAIESIRVESRWNGLGKPGATTYVIARHGEHYERRHSPVSQAAVDRFLAAVTSPTVDRETAERSIATPEWLAARSNEPHQGVPVPVCSPEAKRLVAQYLRDPEEAHKALDQYFSSGWTDDFPFMTVDITFQDGQNIHLESSERPALMLPWAVSKTKTWNPDIPRALVDLLPTDAERRLTDQSLATAYVNTVVRSKGDELDDLEERCVHRHFIEAVEKQFEIVRIYHGSPGWFTAYVRRADFPANLVLTLVIRDDAKAGAQAKLDRTVQRSSAYVDLARSYVARYPGKHFAIWCADGISVEGNERAIKISDYDTASGIVSDSRVILPNGRVTEEE